MIIIGTLLSIIGLLLLWTIPLTIRWWYEEPQKTKPNLCYKLNVYDFHENNPHFDDIVIDFEAMHVVAIEVCSDREPNYPYPMTVVTYVAPDGSFKESFIRISPNRHTRLVKEYNEYKKSKH